MSKSNLSHLEKVSDAIKNAQLSEDEKSEAYKKIEEWYQEDRGMDLLATQLINISAKIEPILKEIGLI
ncbi:MAG: hypothetical protein DSZ06_00635 [Sulfurospirillum sp.]|nr:MAG: hypothetical protein DSZ06_00635 [Sulfurospirillum sp.]